VIRPRVIVSVIATVDGRVALNRSSRLLDPSARLLWESAWPPDVPELLARGTSVIEASHPTVVLEGSGTFVPDSAPPLPLAPMNVPPGDFLPAVGSPRWFAVVDGRGRMEWSFKGDDTTRLLVIVNPATPSGYLGFLRSSGIPYLSASGLPAMIEKFGSELGATCVVSEAGGGLNGALLRAGLVDELHVITVPAVVGGFGTPSMFDGPPLGLSEAPVKLRTVDVQVGGHGSIWTRYKID
jgi:2,5-diamino-6-(ribosylamino)-4(3H)-pyrimidinone 5'-phosphate reductase